MKTEFLDKRLERLEQLNALRDLDFEEGRELAEIKRIKQLILCDVSGSYLMGVKEFGLKLDYSHEKDGRKFLEVFADNGKRKFQEWCKYKDGSFNYR
jgi:hypothetical protein